jgi:DNA repair protein RecN (Recombination protein N)
VLLELRIRNLAIIEELNLSFSPGLNVLTGETGAGKSIIIDAIGLLLGDKSDRTLVRTGADKAIVEGVLALDEDSAEAIRPLMEEYGLLEEGDENLILYRELAASGRSVGRANGRAINLSLLRELGECLVDVHGQSEHLSLLRVRNHLDMLDRYAGTSAAREELAAGVGRLRALQEEIRGIERDQARQTEHAEALRFRLQEIEEAQLKPGEEEELRLERQRLQNGTRLLESVERLHTALAGGKDRAGRAGSGGVLDLLGLATREMETLLHLDPSVAGLRDHLVTASDQVEDLIRGARAYHEQLDLDPRRLAEVEDRLVLVREMERKYGPSIEQVLAAAQSARAELATLAHSGERLEALREEEKGLLRELGRLAGDLSARRQEAADQLGQAVEATMADLNMAGTTFAVPIERVQNGNGLQVEGDLPFPAGRYAYDASGIDRVEFLLAPNPGEEPRPLARIASGGESSRLLLAVKSILSHADATPVLIFDEIDMGVGGRSGYVVGEKLWQLSRQHQVLCITHLPQIAVYADAHFSISKYVQDGRTLTDAVRLEGPALIDELAVMLGGPEVSTAHRESARQIWEHACRHKSEQEA